MYAKTLENTQPRNLKVYKNLVVKLSDKIFLCSFYKNLKSC